MNRLTTGHLLLRRLSTNYRFVARRSRVAYRPSDNRSGQLETFWYRQQTTRMVQGVVIENDCIVNRNPATGQVIERVPCTKLSDLDGLVATARAAQPGWAATPIAARMQALKDGLAALAQHDSELATLIVQEMGKPLSEARAEVDGAVHKDEFLEVLQGALQPQQHGSSVVVRQPLGTVVVLSPWNYPADEILLLTLPALGSGNAVIVKPSEVVPLTGQLVVETLASVLPAGVLQLAQGNGAVGAALVQHQHVDMVAMTGSSATGKKILATAAPSLKRCVLELGGKDPMIVLDDADLDQAAHAAVEYSLCNTGQVCCSVERVYVADAVYDAFAEKVTRLAQQYQAGNGMDEDGSNQNRIGPLVSVTQRDHVKGQVDDAVAQGAQILHQGQVPKPVSEHTSFYPVTVLSNVDESMRMYYEETFGPVVALTRFDGSDEAAMRLANDTEYGLAACVYSRNQDRARNVASGIQAGQVGINCYSLDNMHVACPWVGHKQSGFGYHSGREGFHNFSIPKTLVYEPDD